MPVWLRSDILSETQNTKKRQNETVQMQERELQDAPATKAVARRRAKDKIDTHLGPSTRSLKHHATHVKLNTICERVGRGWEACKTPYRIKITYLSGRRVPDHTAGTTRAHLDATCYLTTFGGHALKEGALLTTGFIKPEFLQTRIEGGWAPDCFKFV